jgi:Conserved region in glutamate synthase
VRRIGLARILLTEALRYGLKLRKREYRNALLSRPCIYGTFSGPFGGFYPIKEKCTGCMRCVQEYPGVCTVDRNPEFYAFADSYWASDAEATISGSPVATIAYEAETGKIPIKGMGYKGSFAGPGWDSIWTDMSEIVRPTRDGVYGREFISTIVDVGSKKRFLEFESGNRERFSRTIEVSLPIIFDYLPPNLNSQSILESIAGASVRTGTYFIASPPQSNRLSKAQQQRLIPLISANNAEDADGLIRGARLVELEGCDSSRVVETQRTLRRINPNIIISVRLPLTQKAPDEAIGLVQKGVDAIHLTANYHGESWDRQAPRFIKELIREIQGKLVSESRRDDVTLVASGGITRAEHVPKAVICGADLIAIDTTVLVALQSQLQGECTSPESGRIAPERFDSMWGEHRLVNLLASWHDQLIEILSAMGMRDVRRLRGDVGRAMFNEDLEKEAFKDIARRN